MKKFKTLNSSNIYSVAWENEELFIAFHNGTEYMYWDVPENIFNDLERTNINNGSVGQLFYKTVRNSGFPYRRIK